MKLNAYAKINLMLNVVKKRPDGYHDVDMIMQSISLCDIITLDKTFSGIELSGTGKLVYDETNLAYKAARLFFDTAGIRGGVRIHIDKRIPMCAGMAGGSTDAAAVLSGLNTLYSCPLSRAVLLKISASLGADVPFCIMGGTVRATGIGNVLTAIDPLPRTELLVVKPPVSVSTPQAYAGLDLVNAPHPDTEAATEAIRGGHMEELYSLMANTFEYSIFKEAPEIAGIKQKMLSLGARASLMSGSGSAVFGIFEDSDLLKKALNEFSCKYREVYIAHTL